MPTSIRASQPVAVCDSLRPPVSATSAAKKDYIFAEPVAPSVSSLSFEALIWDELQLHLYQATPPQSRRARWAALPSAPLCGVLVSSSPGGSLVDDWRCLRAVERLCGHIVCR